MTAYVPRQSHGSSDAVQWLSDAGRHAPQSLYSVVFCGSNTDSGAHPAPRRVLLCCTARLMR